MLVPTKHEKLSDNLLVVGSEILNSLKKKSYNVEDLFTKVRKDRTINVDQFYNVLTFLWLVDAVDVDDYFVTFKNKFNVSN